ncbi:MAG: 1-deoxy-D-xylulose-5-phosphate reductoisomerase, partial [Nitrospinota bacterium]|nr:1-deoxy-D-xylulose-5-phosphate reductoisomerase [Nitrospinota bacterium]
EYIEAKWLFGVDTKVEIIVHAQSIIHSMIEFVDTSIIAQLGIPDMRVPIAYALSYPDRFASELPSLDLASMGNLTFEAPDFERFPCLQLAMDAMEISQTMPAVLNAANEIAVQAFLDKLIPYKDISEIIRMVMHNHSPVPLQELQEVLDADRWAREETTKLITVTH